MKNHPIVIEIKANVPGWATLDRVEFLLDLLRQALASENIEVEDVDWYDNGAGK